MNAPSQTITSNLEIESADRVTRTALCLLLVFPRVFAPSLFVWVCALIVKNAKTVGTEKKEKKTHTQLPRFKLALLRQLLPFCTGNLTKQPGNKLQDQFHLWKLCHDNVTHRLKKKHFSRGFVRRARKIKTAAAFANWLAPKKALFSV